LPKDQKRAWIVTPDDKICDFCEALDGQAVALDEPFVSDEYGEVDTPPLHPQCRCTMGLDFTNDEEE
jgi:hypothetical protein